MRPGKYNFICPQGATFSKQLSYLIDSIPVNLTGYTARMQVREKHSSSSVVLDLSTENNSITLGGQSGSILINISASNTSSIFAKTYVYDLELESSDGFVVRLLEGTFNVTPEVTR
jgi:hypothetical protein